MRGVVKDEIAMSRGSGAAKRKVIEARGWRAVLLHDGPFGKAVMCKAAIAYRMVQYITRVADLRHKPGADER